jgi:demethylmenaquinone methyltransferase/2-methoxy-6-polyprenyl-1,4-benzoquinol methylase
MFASIAPRYDFLNHLLSLSIDTYWRRRVVGLLAGRNPLPTDRCLDLCTGTGDLALDVARRLRIETTGLDFCHPMLVRLVAKIRDTDAVRVAESDARQLPFPEARFRFVTVAFGLRNIEHRATALSEMVRVLEPGGSLVVLEFSRPTVPIVRGLFNAYFHRVLPVVGSWISGTDRAYAYLPESVSRFPGQDALAREIESAGCVEVDYRNLTCGIAAMHWGMKPPRPPSPRH